MDIELLGKLRQRPIPLDGRKRHLSLKCRCVVSACSFLHDRS
jgi:hypothetical protein